MITIDGNYLEGGGQVVRTALALSTITGIPCSITAIRGGRQKPGLKAQHVHGVKALEALCQAQTTGAETGSSSLQYHPGPMAGRTLAIDIGTAGAISLLLQTLLLPCCFCDTKVRLKITGGTDTNWSMPFDYVNQIVLPPLKIFADFKVELKRRGYYPKGDGKVELTVTPKIHRDRFDSFAGFLTYLHETYEPFDITDRGPLLQVKGLSHAAAELQRSQVAERQAKAAAHLLKQKGFKAEISSQYGNTESIGSGITLWAIFQGKNKDGQVRLGADVLGEKGKRAELVGQEAAQALLTEIESGAPLDPCLCDNLIPFLGLIGGRIKASDISDHTRTNIYVTEQFLPVKFDVSGKVISLNR
jgi:RNA 3'-phosphate cyclase